MKAFFRYLLLFLAVFILASGAFAFDFFKRNNLVIPRGALGNISLSGMSREQVREIIREKLEKFTQEPFQIAARGEVATVTLNDLKITMNESVIFEHVPFAGSMTNAEILLWSFAGRRVIPNITVEETEIMRAIDSKFPTIPKMKNAHFALDFKTMKIIEGQSGFVPDVDSVVFQIQQNLLFLEIKPIFITFKESPPVVFARDLEEHKKEILAEFPRVLSLFSDKNKWGVNFEKNPQWILFDTKTYPLAKRELPFSLEWDPVVFSNFLQTGISESLEQVPESVRIRRDESGKINFDGRGNDGRSIPRQRLLILSNQAIARKIQEVEIPLSVVPAKVEISPDLQELGIRELIAVGHTRFDGSPQNRMYNIGVGVAEFNGLLIPPGETFSFGKNLGPVDASTGYRKELVIKPEGTIPEFGGGLCQVSSTMYRAAIFAGLPIVERKPHSYAVRYYAQVGGHGLDATVYPPAVDLKFMNDTPGTILIQSYVDGVSAYFKFYGTSDGRKVTMDGPYISNKHSAPKEAILIPDPTLKAGEKKQVEKAHGGFDAFWYRFVTKNGETKEEKIVSKYKATQEKFLVGGEVAAGQSIDISVNPFE